MTNDEGMTKHEDSSELDEWSWLDNETASVREKPEKNRVYDLEERTARFGEAVIDFAKTIPQNPVTNRLISQLVGAGTSVGANYVEADDSVSKKDFLKSIGTCRKGSTRNKTFPSHDCSGGARAEAASTQAVDGSQGAPFDLLKNLERPKE
ncbi:MAG: four helix bundle protein [Candidatus Udaeobacter sp.]